MDRTTYRKITAYMESQICDSAHDREHVMRVLYTALDIAEHEPAADRDTLIAACLLHDIARAEQFADPAVCHARLGGEKAERWLRAQGFDAGFARHVRACIQTHRYRADCPPESLEAKILFDADKIDVTGALGIARTLLYQGHEGEPVYSVDEQGHALDGTKDEKPSFMREYHFKLKRLCGQFYTQRAGEIAAARRQIMQTFYESLLKEVQGAYADGEKRLQALLSAEQE